MITSEQYFQAKPHTAEHEASAQGLLVKVNTLCEELGFTWPIDKDTGTNISGSKGGSGDGGFRLSTATTGVAGSKHKQAHAVDVYDPDNWLDNKLNDVILAQHGLYREHPEDTPGWCHLQDVAPGSNRRTFKP